MRRNTHFKCLFFRLNNHAYIAGMIGAGLLGSILGLQGGIIFWLLQYLSGETVEDRWNREFKHTRNLIASRAKEKTAADPRTEIVAPEAVAGTELERRTEGYLAEQDWLRNTVIKVRRWAERNGLLPPPELATDNK